LSAYRSQKPGFPSQDPRLEKIQPTDMDDMELALHSLDGNVAQHIEAHGLAKGSLSAQLAILVEKLKKGKLDSEYTAPLDVPDDKRAALGSALGTAGGGAYKGGGFVICSEFGGSLKQKIGFVIVSSPFTMDNHVVDGVGILKSKFPGVMFVPYQKAVAYVNAIAKSGKPAAQQGQQGQQSPAAAAGQAPRQWSMTGFIKSLGVDPAVIKTLDMGQQWLITVAKRSAANPAGISIKMSKDGKQISIGPAGKPAVQVTDTAHAEQLLTRLLA